MNKAGKWAVCLTIIMIISFAISGFFFLKSGLIDLENGHVNKKVLVELEIASCKYNKIFNIDKEKDCDNYSIDNLMFPDS